MNSVGAKYDVAIVGSGPAGMATACLLGSLDRKLKIIVFDKRPETTRDHKLAIGSDSINAMSKFLMEGLAASTNCVNTEAARQLLFQLKSWSKKSIPTSTIETTLATFAKERLNITVHRDKAFNIKYVAESSQKKPGELSFDDFLKQTGGARVIIGADGSKSEIRNVIGAQKTDILNLGYLLELKYKATPNFKPRTYLQGSTQFVMSSGFDFETAGKPRNGNSGIITLHKFVSYLTHRILIQGTKGNPENPWTMSELKEHVKDNGKIRKILDHFECYLGSHKVASLGFNRIVTFPMTIYRSSSVASLYKGIIILLVGDASSGLVLERGVNKAFLEATQCARAVLKFFNKRKNLYVGSEESIDDTKPSSVQARVRDSEEIVRGTPKTISETATLPSEFIEYQAQSHSLFLREVRWARFKHFILYSAQFLFKFVLSLFFKPFEFFRRKPS